MRKRSFGLAALTLFPIIAACADVGTAPEPEPEPKPAEPARVSIAVDTI